LLVVEALAVEFEVNEEAGQVVACLGPPARRELQNVPHHGRDFRDGFGVLGAVLRDGHDRVEEIGVELPAVVRQAHQLHGEDGRDRAGVVEHEIDLAVADSSIEEPVCRLFHKWLHLLHRARGEERSQRMP
jgi:hypothetical protein